MKFIKSISDMFHNISNTSVVSLASPASAVLFPLLLAIVAILFPPSLYTELISEPNLIFLNVKLFIYVLSCIIFFLCGYILTAFYLGKLSFLNKILNKKKSLNNTVDTQSNIYLFYIIITITFFFEIIFLVIFNNSFYNLYKISLLEAALTGKAHLIKGYGSAGIQIPYRAGHLHYFILGLTYWIIFNLYELENNYTSKIELAIRKISAYAVCGIYLCIEILLVERTMILCFFFGFLAIFIHKFKLKLYKTIAIGVIFIISIFFITFMFRFSLNNNINNLIQHSVGYSITNYNRAASILNKKLNYIEDGVPQYFFVFPFQKIPFTEIRVFNFATDYANKTGASLAKAGLNSSYNMSTLFGSIFLSLGKYYFVFFIVYGILGGILYILFISKKSFGIVFYPFFYASVALFVTDVNPFFLYFPIIFFSYIFILGLDIGIRFLKLLKKA